MTITDKVWGALISMIKLEDRVTRQNDAIKAQQAEIENLTERVIRLEAQLEFLTSAAVVKKLTRGLLVALTGKSTVSVADCLVARLKRTPALLDNARYNLAACRTLGAAAANWPQRFFYRLLAP